MGLLVLLVLTVLVVPALLVFMLRSTSLFWLPGAALIGLAIVQFASIDGAPGEAGVTQALVNTILVIGGMGCAVYGVICLLVAGMWDLRRARR